MSKKIKEYSIDTYIADAITAVIKLAKSDKTDYILVYNKWFKLTVTPTTTLDYGLRLFFAKSMSQTNLGMGVMQEKQYS